MEVFSEQGTHSPQKLLRWKYWFARALIDAGGNIEEKRKSYGDSQAARLHDLLTKAREACLHGDALERDDKEVREALKELLEDSEIWEQARENWLTDFFAESEEEPGFGLQHLDYKLSYGIILGPDTKVVIEPHTDFPTQAILWNPRASTREIVGIYFNPTAPSPHNRHPDEAIGRTSVESHEKVEPLVAGLEYLSYRMPEHPAIYAMHRYTTAFKKFLARHNYSTETIEKYAQTNLDLQKKYSPRWSERGSKTALDETSARVSRQMIEELGKDEVEKIDALARQFIEEYSPIKPGEALSKGLIRIAEKKQIPIYTTRGEVLWPKRMSNEEVKQFVGERNSRKNEAKEE